MLSIVLFLASLQTVTGVGLGKALVLLDGHELKLGLLVNVQPRVGVVAAIPGDIGTTSKAGNVPGYYEGEASREESRLVDEWCNFKISFLGRVCGRCCCCCHCQFRDFPSSGEEGRKSGT
jgi:hypothetical protein